jgi:glycosyltransferase involved in cell wall biosynthesis
MRVLFTTPIMEFPAKGGPQLRIENSIKALSKMCDLTVAYRSLDKNIKSNNLESSNYKFKYVNFYIHPNFFLLRIISKFIYKFFLDCETKFAEQIISYARYKKINIIWFGFGNISFRIIQLVRQKLPKIKIVCDTDSVWSRYILRELPFANNSLKPKIKKIGLKKEIEEKELVKLSDVITGVSQIDCDYYRNLTDKKEKIFQFSNVIDLKNYKFKNNLTTNIKNPSIYFAGSFGPNSPMNLATEWFVEKIFPKILNYVQDVHLYIIGRNSKEEFGHISNKNISILGEVNSVLPYFWNIDVAIVPLKYESGTRFKILEAGACKRPVVSTTLGAEGINIVHNQNILIADDPEEFADAVIKLIENVKFSEKIRNNLYELIKMNYSLENLESEINNIFNFLITK